MRVSTAQAITSLIPDIDPSFGDGRELETRQGNLNEGGRRRFVIGNIAPLTPSTTYYFKITCGTRVLPGEFTTAVESTEAPPRMAVSLAPHSGSGVTKAVIDYGDTPALGTVSSVAGCASGCSLNVPLRQHDVVYWRYRYLDNVDGVKGVGPVRAMVTP